MDLGRRQQAEKGNNNNNNDNTTISVAPRPILPRSLNHMDLCTPSNRSNAEQTKHIPLQELEAVIHVEFAKGSPRIDLLLGLTQLNIVRALYSNADVLKYKTADMQDDSVSAFCVHGAGLEYDLLPPTLQPTSTQCAITHHPWLDLIPIPKMRDNLIRAGDSIDDLRLCHDMCGYRVSATGFLIWNEPWDTSGWEVTESFLQVWGWAVRDCWDLFQSTNKWRRKRGERPLFRLPEESP
jgi:Domain of unknown function (DUF3425)